MKISNANQAPSAPLDADHFTGAGRLHDLGAWDAGHATALVVRFEAGTRNHWHRHPGGQLLYVLDGTGRVANREREVEIGPGDLVITEADEDHWHGASADAPMSHLAIQAGTTEWLEPTD
jgi:quercetin dioxygenase-like cupin family protein